MKKVLISASIVAACVAAPVTSHAADGKGFVTLEAGRDNFSDSGLSKHVSNAFGIKGGYRWDLGDNFSLGGEVGYFDFGHTSGRSSWTQGPADPAVVTGPGPVVGSPTVVMGPGPSVGNVLQPSIENSYTKIGLHGPIIGITSRYNFFSNFFATAEAGAYDGIVTSNTVFNHESGGVSSTVVANTWRLSGVKHYIGAFGGFGVGYSITPNVDVSFNIDRFSAGNKEGGSVNMFSAGLGINF